MSEIARLPSNEFFRQSSNRVDQFELSKLAIGIRATLQSCREIGRLHTFYPGERAELDYTKYIVYLFPNASWAEPVVFYTGLCIDHSSGVIKGYTITPQPTAATGVRLYKSAVLPKRLMLPAHLRRYADEWDVMGVDRLVALDNAMDLQSDSMTLMLVGLGIIVLCMPPGRGDGKGKMERTNWSVELNAISAIPGYVHKEYSFTDPRSRVILEKALRNARYTVAEYEELLVLAILEHNRLKHPDYKKPRLQVYRQGLEAAPLVLPTGLRQLRSDFALTYECKVSPEGVVGDSLQFNSPELHDIWRTSREKVHLKVDPDDVRTALVWHHELRDLVPVTLKTLALSEPTSFEIAQAMLGRGGDPSSQPAYGASSDPFLQKLHELQTSSSRSPHGKRHVATQAAVHAAALPPVPPAISKPLPEDELANLFGMPIEARK